MSSDRSQTPSVMRPRLAAWLAVFAIVVAVAAATVVVHDHSAQAMSLGGAKGTVSGATAGVFVANDPTPSNRDHLPVTAAPLLRGPASVVIGSYQQALINQDRAAAGLPPLSWSSCLAAIAAANAVRQSREGWVQPYHTNGATLDLGCHLGNQAGENVGYRSGGLDDVRLNSTLMNSPEHRANILGPYHYVATVWAVASNGYAYIAEEFG